MATITARSLKGNSIPKRVLAIRLQAMGDTLITLPYLNDLRQKLPKNVQLDFLTREEVQMIPASLNLFGHVYSIAGARNHKKQWLFALLLLPKLLLKGYDVVIDLQNNRISRMIRKCISPKAWSEFDRYSALPAGVRTQLTIQAVGLSQVRMNPQFSLKQEPAVEQLLRQQGWNGQSKLVLLNPAGAFSSRNWPVEYYIEFSQLWLQKYPDSQMVMLGLNQIAPKAKQIKNALGTSMINLVNQTSVLEAFCILQKTQIVLSEDSGLMHMAWISGRPTVVLLGSTRSDWVRPQSQFAVILGSDDLPCGNCMLEHCRFEDNHCLTRYTPQLVLSKTISLINKVEAEEKQMPYAPSKYLDSTNASFSCGQFPGPVNLAPGKTSADQVSQPRISRPGNHYP